MLALSFIDSGLIKQSAVLMFPNISSLEPNFFIDSDKIHNRAIREIRLSFQ